MHALFKHLVNTLVLAAQTMLNQLDSRSMPSRAMGVRFKQHMH